MKRSSCYFRIGCQQTVGRSSEILITQLEAYGGRGAGLGAVDRDVAACQKLLKVPRKEDHTLFAEGLIGKCFFFCLFLFLAD